MLAFTFPGQGSQKPGMGAPWVDTPSWRLVDEASQAAGRDVSNLLLKADADELTQTHNAQLATFVLSMVVLDALKEAGLTPEIAAGHSLGEFSALVASGALSFSDGCKIVIERGESMQAAAVENPGSMYAVLGLDDESVDIACNRADGEVWVANYNAPGQVVIAGEAEALKRAAEIAKELGAKRAVQLPVGGAFHTHFMAPARARLHAVIEAATYNEPAIPIAANVDAIIHKHASEWPALSNSQLCSPVRWCHAVQHIHENGASVFIEVGPGNVLTNLAKRIVPEALAYSVSDPEHIQGALEAAAQVIDVHEAHHHEGEHLAVDEKLIVSTTTGLFDFLDPPQGPAIGDLLIKGAPIARVGDTEICTLFAGRLMGTLAIVGERVTVGQPIAWLRSEVESA